MNRSTARLAAVVTAGAALTAAAVVVGGGVAAAAVPADSTSGLAYYQGVATVRVDTYGDCGTGSATRIGSRTVTEPVTMVVAEGAGDGAVNFVLGSDPQTGTGTFAIATDDGGSASYWSGTYDSYTARLSGTIDPTHVGESAEFNIVRSTQPNRECDTSAGTTDVTKPMGSGTAFHGTLSPSAATMELIGSSSDHRAGFQVETTLTRTSRSS